MDQSLYCSPADAGLWGERGCGDGSTPYAGLSSIAMLPWLLGFPPQGFPTTISFPHILTIHLSAANSNLCPGVAPQSLNSSSQPLCLPGDQCSCPGYVFCSKDCLILIPFRLPQISCFTSSLKCFSSDSDNCPSVGIGPPASVTPPTEGRSSPIYTPIFPPSSFILPSFVVLYILFH